MSTQRRDIVVRRGDPYTHVIEGQNADGTPKDLSGTWASQVRKYADDDTVAATFTADTSQAAAARVVLSLTEADTAVLVPGSYVWDVQWDGHGTPIGGTFTLTPDVTRP